MRYQAPALPSRAHHTHFTHAARRLQPSDLHFAEDFAAHSSEILERNGSLVCLRNAETGEEDFRAAIDSAEGR